MDTPKISEQILEYISKDVEMTLGRLGIDTQVTIFEKTSAESGYELKTMPFTVTPAIFKRITIWGQIIFNEYSEEHIEMNIYLRYSYMHWDGGSNGCNLGRMTYLIRRGCLNNDKLAPWRMAFAVERQGIVI